jgi:hypothetical protein
MAARTRRILPILIGVPLVLAAWATSVEALTFFQPPGRPLAVVARGGMQGALAAVVAANGYILQVRGDMVIAISDEAGFVPRLYRNGALLVVLSSTGGCIVDPSSPSG